MVFGGVGVDIFEWDVVVFVVDDMVGDFEDGMDIFSFVGIGFGDVLVIDVGVDMLVMWVNGLVMLIGIDYILIIVDDF